MPRTNPMTPDPREDRLPAWAQANARALRERAASAEAALAALTGPENPLAPVQIVRVAGRDVRYTPAPALMSVRFMADPPLMGDGRPYVAEYGAIEVGLTGRHGHKAVNVRGVHGPLVTRVESGNSLIIGLR